MLSKNVYFFGDKKAEGDVKMAEILGRKGANLAEMTNLGLPVPPGFTITTDVCAAYHENEGQYPKDLDTEVHYALTRLEKLLGKKLGDPKNPLLVSVRPGTAVPAAGGGLMESILNVGLNDQSAAGLAEQSGDPRFAWDAYRRFIEMYGHAVMGVDRSLFEDAMSAVMAKRAVKKVPGGLTVDDLKDLTHDYQKAVRSATKRDFPQNAQDQLWGAIQAVICSWKSPQAVACREAEGLLDSRGTAVSVQVMVFGNWGDDSGVGVCSSRDPSTGKNEFRGEYLANAQGKDITGGARTPEALSFLQKTQPLVYKRLVDAKNRLERHFHDMQDIEFTVQKGKLFLLQTGDGKRTGVAAIKCALDMVKEGLINREEAIMRVTPAHLDELLRQVAGHQDSRAAKVAAAAPSPQDGTVDKAVTDPDARRGQEEKAAAKITKEMETLLGWCDEARNASARGEVKGFRIRANADTPEEAKCALEFGADGVGLCRTESMFFDEQKLLHFQAMIVAGTVEERKAALKKMLPLQRKDFVGMFKAMCGKPVVIRLLDPPLHEFVPHTKADVEALASHLDMKPKDLQAKIDRLRERNPMLGHRGCRLAVTYPEIYDMQIEAAGLAAADCLKKNISVHPEIIVPMVCGPSELALLRPRAEAVWQKVQDKTGTKIPFRFGTMIEVPRAAFLAGKIAEYADFFSFGVNDLTQMTFAFSRDDAASFVSAYLANDLLDADPFRTIDECGVGEVIKAAVAKGRETKGDLKCGVCGDQGGDPETIDFCYRAGLSYVSCPPFRVPLARLAGAQAVIKNT